MGECVVRKVERIDFHQLAVDIVSQVESYARGYEDVTLELASVAWLYGRPGVELQWSKLGEEGWRRFGILITAEEALRPGGIYEDTLDNIAGDLCVMILEPRPYAGGPNERNWFRAIE